MVRRRTVAILATFLAVAALAAGVGAGRAGVSAGQADTYVVEQAGDCTEVRPLSYEDLPVEEFYGYTAEPSSSLVRYSANTPLDLEEDNDGTSSIFLYRGPDRLALVVLHGAPNGSAGGAATFEFVGLPDDGEWVVRDDPENESVERWNRRTDDGLAVDWGWRDAYTDGGAFAGGLDGEFEVRIEPAFGEEAAVDPVTPGAVETWRALSGEDGSIESIDLETDEPVTVRTGSCG